LPSPVGHSIAGLTVHVLSSKDESELWSSRRALALVVAANAADLDLLPGLVDGRNHHQQETHSIGFALVAALCAWTAFRVLRWPRAGRLALACGAAWLTHLLLDYLNEDTNPPIGIPVFWPVSHGYWKFPWPIFFQIGRTLTWQTLRSNTLAAAWEALALLPLLAVAWRFRAGRGQRL
jgi:inner membrane protein